MNRSMASGGASGAGAPTSVVSSTGAMRPRRSISARWVSVQMSGAAGVDDRRTARRGAVEPPTPATSGHRHAMAQLADRLGQGHLDGRCEIGAVRELAVAVGVRHLLKGAARSRAGAPSDSWSFTGRQMSS